MTGLGEIAAILGIAKKANDILGSSAGVSPEEFAEAQKLFTNAQSIAAQARQGVMMYPMLFSSTMKELDLIESVSKHQEVQYALFTLITAGLNPVSMKKVGDYIESTFGAEGIDALPQPEDGDIPFEIAEPSRSDIAAGTEIVQDSMAAYDFGDNRDELALESGDPDDEDAKDLRTPNSPSDFGSKNIDQVTAKKGPTVLNLKLKIPGFQNEITIPVVVKAVPHLLAPAEMSSLFEYAVRDKNILHRFIQWTTGEIKFFRDFIFQIDQAERDTKAYTSLGRHPWYKELEQRKALSKMKQGINIFGNNGKSNTLPTATIVCTKDEIALASKMSYKFLLKNPQFINKIIDSLFLLGLIVYDPDMEVFHVHYAGYRQPIMYTKKELISSESKGEAEMAKAISMLVQKM